MVSSEEIIDNTKKTNSWVLTKFGLQNQGLNNDPQQDLIKKIDKNGAVLLQQTDVFLVPLEKSQNKKQLYAAIQSLDEPYKSQYMDKFSLLFS